LIDPVSFKVTQLESYNTKLYTEVTDLKRNNPGLQVWIAVGGWSAGGEVFSNTCATAANRAAFITSTLQF
jgi:chitinase